MNVLEKWLSEFQTMVPTDMKRMTLEEANFFCLQGISFMIDKMVNVGYRDLIGKETEKKDTPEDESSWCNINELCKRHPELCKSNVVSRQWRLDNNFPSKGGYKCRQIFYEPDVVEWIDQHLRGKKC